MPPMRLVLFLLLLLTFGGCQAGAPAPSIGETRDTGYLT